MLREHIYTPLLSGTVFVLLCMHWESKCKSITTLLLLYICAVVIFYLLISTYLHNWMNFDFDGVAAVLPWYVSESLILQRELIPMMFILNKVNLYILI